MDFYINLPVIPGGGGDFLPLSGGTLTGDLFMGTHDIVSSGRVTQGNTAHTVTDGETYTIANSWAYVIFNSGGVSATQTTNMPPNPISGQTVTIDCIGGGITAWTLTTTDGSVIAPSPPTSLVVGQSVQYLFIALGPGYWVQLINNLPVGSFLPSVGGTLSGSLLFSPDGTENIGDIANTARPANVYVSSSVVIGADVQSVASLTLADNTISVDPNGDDVMHFSSGIFVSGGSQFQTGASISGASGGIDLNNGASPSAIALLTSTVAGFAPPRMTTTEKLAIDAPIEGLMVYDLTLHALTFFDGTIWKTVAGV